MDRPTAKYDLAMNNGALTTDVYDQGGYLGLLSGAHDAIGETKQLTYDAAGRLNTRTYLGDNGVTPGLTYQYDPKGQTVSIKSTQVGTQSFSFDADGRELQTNEPSGGGITSSAAITYGYYPNGWRRSLSVTSSGLNKSKLFAYTYRGDGLLRTLSVNLPGGGIFSETYTPGGHPKCTSRGRLKMYQGSVATFGLKVYHR